MGLVHDRKLDYHSARRPVCRHRSFSRVGSFAPAPDLREVLGKRGGNWVAGQVGNLRRLATAACAGKTTGAQFAKLPHNRVPVIPRNSVKHPQKAGERWTGLPQRRRTGPGLPQWSVHDLHAALLYLRDVDHQRVCGDVVRPVTASYGRRRPCGRPRGASNGLRQ